MSSATTDAAARGAPASTSVRTAVDRGRVDARARRRAADDEHDLARGGLAGVARGELGGGAAHDLLVQLGQLAADGDRAASGSSSASTASDAPTRRGDSNATTRLRRGEDGLQRAALARQEAGEAPGVGRQRARHQRGQRGATGPGSTSTASPAATQPCTST